MTMCDEKCAYCEDDIACALCGCCIDCCTCEDEEILDPEYDEDFGGYPHEEPARFERYARAMLRAMEMGVD